MKFHNKSVTTIILSLFMLLAFVACSPTGSGGNLEPELGAAPDLDNSSWVLDEFGPIGEETAVLPNTTITITFTQDGVNGSAGCNSYFATLTQDEFSLTIGGIGSTRMACEQPIMTQEAAYLTALGHVTSFSLGEAAGKEVLTLNYEDGRLAFHKSAAEDAADESEETNNVKTLFVGPELVDCVGVAPQQCMQVRESADDEWTLFYDPIVGFTFEPGFEYELRVSETEIENPPADGSSIEIALVQIVSQTAVATTLDDRPEGNTLEGSSWILVSFGPDDNQTAVLPNTELTLNFEDGQINGSAGCNSYFAGVTFGEDGSLELGMMGSTLMACVDESVTQQEMAFLTALGQATRYTLERNKLTLHTADGALKFVSASMHDIGLEGEEVVDWETAVAILNSGEVVEIFQTHSLDVTLTLADGRIIKTVEPALDDVFTAVTDCGAPCSNIRMATE